MTLAAGYGTISDFEVFFLLISIFGLVFSILNLFNVVGDLRYLQQEKIRNGSWYLAKVAVVSESGRAYLQAVFIFIAILTMRQPDPPPEIKLEDQILSAIARWAFLIGAGWVAGKTAYAWYVRKRLLETDFYLNNHDKNEIGEEG